MKNLTRKQQIRDVSMEWMLRNGFHGFSFQHIADEIGVRKPSLFDHYSSKEMLGVGLIDEYRLKFEAWTERIAALAPEKKLVAFFDIFADYAKEGKICLVGSLGVEMETLPDLMKERIEEFFAFQKSWVERTVREGQIKGIFHKRLSAKLLANSIASLILGAEIRSRLERDSRPILEMKKVCFELLNGELGKSRCRLRSAF